MNWAVVAILSLMAIIIVILASLYVATHNQQFENLWYLGFYQAQNETDFHWPYLPELEPPKWKTEEQNWIQMFFLFLTLLNNIIPMSLYVTVEFLTFVHQWFINVDENMYDDTTNTRAVARSTNVTDLGRVQYIFSVSAFSSFYCRILYLAMNSLS
jgi:magnesium-transporting ATPase (P-type)